MIATAIATMGPLGCVNGRTTSGQAGDEKNDETRTEHAAKTAPGENGAMLELKLTPATGTKIDVELVNRGEEAVRVNGRLGVSRPGRGGDLFFDIQDADGADVEFTARVNIGAPGPSEFKTLEPGQSVESTIDLSQYFALGKAKGPLQVTATYGNRYDPPEGEAWLQEVSSEPVSLALP